MFGAFSSFFSGSSKAEEKEYESSTQEVFDLEWTLLEEQSLPQLDCIHSDTSDLCNLSDVSVCEDFHYLSSPSPSSPVLLSPIPSPTLSSVDFIPITPPSTILTPYPSYPILLADSVSYDCPEFTFSVGDFKSILYSSSYDIPMENSYFHDVLVVPSSCIANNIVLGKKELSLIKMEYKAEKRALSVSVALQKKEINAKQFRRKNKVTHNHSNRRRGGNLGRRKC